MQVLRGAAFAEIRYIIKVSGKSPELSTVLSLEHGGSPSEHNFACFVYCQECLHSRSFEKKILSPIFFSPVQPELSMAEGPFPCEPCRIKQLTYLPSSQAIDAESHLESLRHINRA